MPSDGDGDTTPPADGGDTTPPSDGAGDGPVTTFSEQDLKDMLVADALTDAGTDHLEPAGQDISLGGASGDYAYVDRSFGGAVVYDADGTSSNIDFVGNENTFVLDASSEFDFFGLVMILRIQMILK